ncbi:MAG: gyrA [Gemmatimonadetes bacterium]|nr:gyrA [Gemmatimonadota bacterium]
MRQPGGTTADDPSQEQMNKQRDRIVPRLIEDEMRESFLDYSMSVIVQRALPDVRDGLKPVHRRILFAMHEAGLTPARPHKKSATVVGDVLGKYHPHGDASVYDAMVRMVQDFSLRYPLVDGQGNFGSIDGDGAAAYRYTEARLSAVATEMLADIDRETVDLAPNYDDRLKEPTVLPARLPNLLVNGSSGIAVGMSTNVPPHNLGEVVRAAVHLLDHPDCTIDDLMGFVPGPDFPTGGVIVGTKGIREAYEKGRGRVIMRARVYKEQKRNGREQLVVTEIPYGTNKARILEQIAELAKSGKVQDLSDLRDESDRDGIRIVVEMKKGADAVKILNALFKWTALQSTFGVISLALDRGVPREFTLKQMLERWRDHRVEVVVRRAQWELARARDEAHVLEGLVQALRYIDQVIALIRGSRNRDTASGKLQKELKLTERQADAILAMRLSKLTQLEGKELRDRLAELAARIAELDALLASPERQVSVIRGELLALDEQYGDPRRTDIVESEKDFSLKDLLADEEVVVAVSHEGYVKQIPMGIYRRRRLLGKSIGGADKADGDYLEHAFVASTSDTLMFFTEDGRVHWLPVREVPEAGISARGKRLQQLFEMHRRGRIAAMLSVREFPAERSLLFATADGTVKRTSLDQYGRPRAGGIEAIALKPGDRVAEVLLTAGDEDVVMAGRGGRAIRFRQDEVPVTGRVSQGVRGIKLKEGEALAGMAVVRRDDDLCLVTERGQAKRVPMDELPVQGRGGLGTVLVHAGRDTGALAAARGLHPDEDLMAVTAVGRTLRLNGDAITRGDRALTPAPALPLSAHDRVVEVTRLAEPREKPGSGGDDDDGGPGTDPDATLELGEGVAADDDLSGGSGDAEPESSVDSPDSADVLGGDDPVDSPASAVPADTAVADAGPAASADVEAPLSAPTRAPRKARAKAAAEPSADEPGHAGIIHLPAAYGRKDAVEIVLESDDFELAQLARQDRSAGLPPLKGPRKPRAPKPTPPAAPKPVEDGPPAADKGNAPPAGAAELDLFA